MSRTVFVNAKLIEAPCQPLYDPGPTGIRPRVGLSPIRPLKLAGIRIEPPPSLAAAIGTIPEATVAAAPPLEPPALREGSKGK